MFHKSFIIIIIFFLVFGKSLAKENVFIVNARLNLEDFKSQSGVDLTIKRNGDEYDTIGGLVFNITNRIPARGEVVTDSSGNEFSVLEADPRSIKRLRLNLRS